MAKLNQLIKELCPEGVPCFKISDIADTFIGLATSVTKHKAVSGVQLLHNSDISEGKIIVKTVEYITEAFAQKNSKKLLRKHDVITVHTGNVGTSAVITEEYDGCIGFTTISSRVKNPYQISPEYLCAFLNSNASKEQIAGKSISDRNNLNLAAFDEIIIPVPPLPVQNEIVRILDNFTELTAELITELTIELAARKKQYDYYREHLISEAEGTLGKLIDLLSQPITDGPHTTPKLVSDGIPFVSASAICDGKVHFEKAQGFISKEADAEYARKYKPRRNDVFMVKSGSTTGKVAIVDTDEDFNIWSPLAAMRTENEITARYIYHLLQTASVQNMVLTRMSHGSQPNLSMRVLEQFDVKIPTLQEQERIVSILDRFDTLCNDIALRLPAEIEARQKQYEYYRDKLLTFKEV